jgi:aminopeptidase YwaD
MLQEYDGSYGIEITAFNGEDHYSAAGQMDYLKRYGQTLADILIAVNLDDLGFKEGRSAYTYYECPQEIIQRARVVFRKYTGIVQGEPWYNGDHMIFVQNNVPAIAFTSELMQVMMATITHTPRDKPDQVDPDKLIEVAHALVDLIHHL